MDLLLLKIILVLVMTLVTVVFGLLPMKVLKLLRKRAHSSAEASRWPSLSLCLLSCFTGGVFLSTCFLHLLPETNTHLNTLKEAMHWDLDYPLAELISCAGFFLVFFVEELVILCMSDKHHGHAHHNHAHHNHAHHSHAHTCLPENDERVAHLHTTTSPQHVHHHNDMQRTPEKEENEGCGQQSQSECVNEPNDEFDIVKQRLLLSSNGRTEAISPGSDSSEVAIASGKRSSCSAGGSCANGVRSPLAIDTHDALNGTGLRVSVRQRSSTVDCMCRENLYLCSNSKCPPTTYGSLSNIVADRQEPEPVCVNIELAEPERCEGPCDGIEEDPPILMSSRPHAHSHEVRSVTLIIALSFHSVIEGLAFGVQNTTGSVVTLFVSLLLHKVVIAFSIGLQLSRTHAHQLHCVLMGIVVLALMSPIGATIGIAVEVSNLGQGLQDVLVMVFEGLSVGTFLYVTFFEILIHERDNEHPNLLKLLFTLIGFCVIAAIRLLQHDHVDASHDHDDVDHDHQLVTSTINALINSTINYI